MNRHNSGYEKATKPGKPWILVWSSEKPSREEAIHLEIKLKDLGRDKLIEFLLKYKDNIAGPDALNLLDQWSGC